MCFEWSICLGHPDRWAIQNIIVRIIKPSDLTGVKESSICTKGILVSHVVRRQRELSLPCMIRLACFNLHRVRRCRRIGRMQLECGSRSISIKVHGDNMADLPGVAVGSWECHTIEVHDGERGVATGDHLVSLERMGKKTPGIVWMLNMSGGSGQVT